MADADVLANEDDVLVNVNMIDNEVAEKVGINITVDLYDIINYI